MKHGELEADSQSEAEGGEPGEENHPLQSVNGTTENAVIVNASQRQKGKKKSFLPQIEMDEYNWRKADNSPSGSIRRKFVFTLPGVMKQQQPREYKLKAFVVFLFFLIVIYISLTYVFHKQQQLHLLQLAMGERIHFREETQVLRILSNNKQELLVGQLGGKLPPGLAPYKCSHESKGRCLEWKYMARLRITHLPRTSDLARCYSVVWDSLVSDFKPYDCFELGDANWFGIGETNPQGWTLENLNFTLQPFVTGNVSFGPYGSVLERYWLSSKGVAIYVEAANDLLVSLNSGDNHELCLSSAYGTVDSPSLNYTVCTGWDIRRVHESMVQRLQKKPVLNSNMEAMMKGLVWMTYRLKPTLDEYNLFKFADHILDYKETLPMSGIIVINRGWQKEEGDLVFDPEKFTNRSAQLSAIHNKGFKVAVVVHPYVSTVSSNYMREIGNRRWIMDAGKSVPALTKWYQMPSAAILDFTNYQSREWFLLHTKELLTSGPVDAFWFEGGESAFLPPYHSFYKPTLVSDKYAQLYVETAVATNASISISACGTCQHLPVFVTLAARNSSWDAERGLKSVIPAMLSLAVSGYVFVNPGTVGGETAPSGERIDLELYTRWFQLSIFMPVLQMSVPPDEYGEEFEILARKLIRFRARIVVPRLMRLARKARTTGFPLIRPLWWIAPNDSIALTIDSQFLLDDDLLVAPILEAGAKHRHIYLPAGLWVYQETTKVYHGGRWMDVDVTLDDIVYFFRINMTEQQSV